MNSKSRKCSAKLVAVVFATALLLVGCGKEDTPVTEETISENTVRSGGAISAEEILPEEFADLTQEQLDAVPELETITQQQLYEMSNAEFRALIYKYCPNYKEIYGITSEMTEDKWNSFRMVVSYQLFGKISYTPTYEELDDDVVARGYVKSLLESLENLNVSYNYFDDLEADDCSQLASSFEDASDEELVYCLEQITEEDYSSLTMEELDELRQVFVAEFSTVASIKNVLEEYPEIDIDSIIEEIRSSVSDNNVGD